MAFLEMALSALAFFLLSDTSDRHGRIGGADTFDLLRARGFIPLVIILSGSLDWTVLLCSTYRWLRRAGLESEAW